MKKIFFISAIAIALVLAVSPVMAVKPTGTCATIQGGTITDSAGQPVTLGYDQWGYNYQAHMFNGWYDNFSRPTTPVTNGDNLMMKWNDAWLSNKDCDSNGKLDRHFGLSSYFDSGAWLTNHASGSYPSTTKYHWNLDVNWILGFNSTSWSSGNPYLHDMVVTGSTATGGWQAGGSYTNTWTATVTVTGDIVTIVADYLPGSGVYPYTFTATGNITTSGLNGDWTDTTGDHGTWSSTSGVPIKISDEMCEWSDFVKVVAVPTDATSSPDSTNCPFDPYGLDNAMWYNADGTQIGCSIWGEFAVIQEVSTDSCGEKADIRDYRSPLRSGLGNW